MPSKASGFFHDQKRSFPSCSPHTITPRPPFLPPGAARLPPPPPSAPVNPARLTPAPAKKARAHLSSKEHLSCSAIKSPAPRHDLNSCPRACHPRAPFRPRFIFFSNPAFFLTSLALKPISPVPPIYSNRSSRSKKIPLLMESNQMQ